MDSEGWVQLGLVFNFNQIVNLRPDFEELKNKLMYGFDGKFELDIPGDRLRLREFSQWVIVGTQMDNRMHYSEVSKQTNQPIYVQEKFTNQTLF